MRLQRGHKQSIGAVSVPGTSWGGSTEGALGSRIWGHQPGSRIPLALNQTELACCFLHGSAVEVGTWGTGACGGSHSEGGQRALPQAAERMERLKGPQTGLGPSQGQHLLRFPACRATSELPDHLSHPGLSCELLPRVRPGRLALGVSHRGRSVGRASGAPVVVSTSDVRRLER